MGILARGTIILASYLYLLLHIHAELATELKEALVSSVHLQSVSIRTATDEDIEHGGIESILGLPSDFVAWIEIALTFTSITIATSVLNKIGEDIYSQLRKKLTPAL